MERLIFHVDVNSAFLAWEAAKRVAEGGEDLRLIPSCIGGDPTRRSSIVTAKSIPAKKLGIKTGEPVAMALRKCPDLVIAEPDFHLYERNSAAFMDICREYTPALEKFSIDECFMDMSGTGYMYKDPVALAHTIKDRIRDELGFTVNIGIGPNKLLAKTAGDFEKPDKVHTLFMDELPTKFWPLPIHELLFVGKQTAERLKKLHIAVIGDLAKLDVESVQSLVGVKFGTQIHQYANGIDHSPVQAKPPEAKSYGVATTVDEDIVSWDRAHQILADLADTVTFRMRSDHAAAYCVTVTIRGSDFKDKSHQKHLDRSTDVTSEVYEIARHLLGEHWNGKTPLRLIGLSLSDVTRDGSEQTSLFEDKSREREQKLDRVMDTIRRRYGSDSVSRGAPYAYHNKAGRKYKAKFEFERAKEKSEGRRQNAEGEQGNNH